MYNEDTSSINMLESLPSNIVHILTALCSNTSRPGTCRYKEIDDSGRIAAAKKPAEKLQTNLEWREFVVRQSEQWTEHSLAFVHANSCLAEELVH